VKKDLGTMWRWLPEGALNHDPHAYLKSVDENMPAKRSVA